MNNTKLMRMLTDFYRYCTPADLKAVFDKIKDDDHFTMNDEGQDVKNPDRIILTYRDLLCDEYFRIAFRKNRGDYLLIEYGNKRPFEITDGVIERLVPELLEIIHEKHSDVFAAISRVLLEKIPPREGSRLTMGKLRELTKEIPDNAVVQVNSIVLEESGEWEPSEVAEVHYSSTENAFYITPEVVSLPDECLF